MKTNRIRQNFLPLLTALIWGTAFVAQSVGAEYMGPFTFNTARAVIAFFFLLCLCGLRGLYRRKTGGASPAGSRRDLLLGGLCCGAALAVALVGWVVATERQMREMARNLATRGQSARPLALRFPTAAARELAQEARA